MQRKLVIYLDKEPLNQHADVADGKDLNLEGNPSWTLVVDNQVKQSAHKSEPGELVRASEDAEVIMIVPAEDVLLVTANLPKMNRSRLLSALPYALEEHLTEEVDALHFAVGEYQPDHHLPVAIVAHHKMKEWLEWAKCRNIKVDKMIPSSLALPWATNSWHVSLTNMAIVRTGAYAGFGCDRHNLDELLTIAALNNEIPHSIQVQNYSHSTLEASLEYKNKVTEKSLSPTQMIADLALNFSSFPTINLLQSHYAAKKSKFTPKSKLWKFIAGLALAWVLLLFCYPIISYFILNQKLDTINSQIAQIYKRNFPKASSVVAPKLRMEEKLKGQTTQMGQHHLLFLMGSLGQGMEKAPSIKLKRFDFQNNQLNLDLTAASSEEFSTFTDFLTQQGLKVKQQNAHLSGSKIDAALSIE